MMGKIDKYIDKSISGFKNRSTKNSKTKEGNKNKTLNILFIDNNNIKIKKLI